MLTKEEYEAKRQARYERLLDAAQRAEREGESLRDQAHDMASVIPFGQPILVGHYSEGRDRNYRNRIENKFRKGFELYERAQELKSRADSIENNNAIYSDDPEATDKLSEKIAALEAKQEHMKAVNKAIKKNDRAALAALGYNEAGIDRLLTEEDFAGRKGFPSYAITNNNANIRRLKERAQIVARKQAMVDTEKEVNGIKIEYVPSENRIRIYFPARVPNETYRELKQHGFRLAPSFGDYVFSAYYNANAKYYADQIANKETECPN